MMHCNQGLERVHQTWKTRYLLMSLAPNEYASRVANSIQAENYIVGTLL